MSKQVIVEYESADGSVQIALVEPTGRLEHRPSASDPEKHWRFEARDARDGNVKMFALADIKQWIEDVRQVEIGMRDARDVARQAA